MINPYLEEQKRIEGENREIVKDIIASGKVLTTEDLPDYEGCEIKLVFLGIDAYEHPEQGVIRISCDKAKAMRDMLFGKFRNLLSIIGLADRRYKMVSDNNMKLVYELAKCYDVPYEKSRGLKIFKADGHIIGLSGEEITEHFGAMIALQICGKEVIVGINGAGYYLIGKDGKAIKSGTFSSNGEEIPHFRDMLYGFLPYEQKQE